ncbi:MAG: serine/threonine protein kinase [Deltaproteobacteria bacterium]|nr:MAG: serine/threonine protein kinase [Deltaproteobacteria bacterium]
MTAPARRCDKLGPSGGADDDDERLRRISVSGSGDERPDFGRYQLVRRVSLGGTAEIYKAKAMGDRGFEKVVALKRLLPHVEEDPAFVRMFVNEARLVAQLDHPRIAHIYELGKVRGSHYMAMEYIYGRDLGALKRALAERGEPAPPIFVAAVGRQVAEALDYAHRFVDVTGTALRIVHRDVSPQNVMVDESGVVRLIDFGIAKYVGVEGSTAAGVVKGKHAYMSPEQVRQEPLDGRSDVFSLGVILHELLAGERLFRAESVLDTLVRVEAARVPELAEVAPDAPEELASAVMACLARRPQDRPSAGELASALAEVCRGLGAADPQGVVADVYGRLFDDAGDTEDEVTLDEYRQALRAAELGVDAALAARDASDITLIPDTADLVAYVEELHRHLREVRAAGRVEGPGDSPEDGPPVHGARR